MCLCGMLEVGMADAGGRRGWGKQEHMKEVGAWGAAGVEVGTST